MSVEQMGVFRGAAGDGGCGCPAQASKYFSKCMQMGPPWIIYCPLTESLRCLYLETAPRLAAHGDRAE
eukprot:5864469-Pyramimonas_sp.AAC.1